VPNTLTYYGLKKVLYYGVQSALMGRYNYEDQHNERPYFIKTFQNKTYFFFFQSEGK